MRALFMRWIGPLSWLLFMVVLFLIAGGQEPSPRPAQPHTDDPAQCARYCYPIGGPEEAPPGTPEGIPGYQCEGTACAHINDHEKEGDVCHEGGGCTSHCAKVCCTCLATCL